MILRSRNRKILNFLKSSLVACFILLSAKHIYFYFHSSAIQALPDQLKDVDIAVLNRLVPTNIRRKLPILYENRHASSMKDYLGGWKNLSSLAHIYTMKETNCAAMFHNNSAEIVKALSLRRRWSSRVFRNLSLNEDFYLRETKNCNQFLQKRGYITSHLSAEEANFPVAFSIIAYKDIEMFERLLRAIYRPQNFYCVHIDAKSKFRFVRAIDAMVRCFPNVIWPSTLIEVIWGKFSVLDVELRCMAALSKFAWKYFINLTGQEFPLQTNAHLVKILKIFNGANSAYGYNRSTMPRWKSLEPEVPLGIRLYKGPVHIAASRPFVDYILHNKNASIFLNWTRHTNFPEETFFSTLNNNPHLGAPGAYNGTVAYNNSVVRYKHWRRRCTGLKVRNICIINTADLPELKDQPELFANKFFLNNDRVVVGCLEELHFNNTLKDYVGNRFFDRAFYENIDSVKNHI